MSASFGPDPRDRSLHQRGKRYPPDLTAFDSIEGNGGAGNSGRLTDLIGRNLLKGRVPQSAVLDRVPYRYVLAFADLA